MPLKGIKVVELAGLAPGPFCGKILQDFGASLIKIQKKNEFISDVLSNGKKSIVIDLKTEEGCEVLKKLCLCSDVLIDPFRKGVMEKLGLGPNILLKNNPKLIYARLSGFGQSGYYSSMAGHDINFLSLTGLLSLFGWREKTPTPPCNFSEFGGGSLICVTGVLLALIDRNKTGLGQVIDSNITEGISYLGSWLMKSQDMIFPNKKGNNWLDGGVHFYDVYETKDEKFMAVGALEPKFYNELISKLGFSEEELPQNGDCEICREKMQKRFKEKTQDEWCQVFDLSDACVTPVLSIEEATKHRHNVERKSFGRDKENIVTPMPAPRLDRHIPNPASFGPPAELGQHTVEVLKDLKYSDEEIGRLMQSGVVWTGEISKY